MKYELEERPPQPMDRARGATTEMGRMAESLVKALGEHPPNTYLTIEPPGNTHDNMMLRKHLRQRVVRWFPGFTLTMYMTEDGRYAIARVRMAGR